MQAQRAAVAVSSHGQITGYFVGPDEYEEFRHLRDARRSFATAELPDEKIQAIDVSRIDARHAPLDDMLERSWRRVAVPTAEAETPARTNFCSNINAFGPL